MSAPLFKIAPNPSNPDLFVGPPCPDCGVATGGCHIVWPGNAPGAPPTCRNCYEVVPVAPATVGELLGYVHDLSRWLGRDWRAHCRALERGAVDGDHNRGLYLPWAVAPMLAALEAGRRADGWEIRRLSGATRDSSYVVEVVTPAGVMALRFLVTAYQAVSGSVAWKAVSQPQLLPYHEEVARAKALRARRSDRAAIYKAALTSARVAVDADPMLRGTLEVVACVGWPWGLHDQTSDAGGAWHRVNLARVCLALAGWRHNEGQAGGTVTPPGSASCVSLRGLLRLPL